MVLIEYRDTICNAEVVAHHVLYGHVWLRAKVPLLLCN